ncbi:MAG: oligogalacturonate lyase family protein, partial [Terrimicrobiaceae bacterium]
TQWTQSPCKNHHLYFTSHSVTADNRWLVFLSDRDGHPNVYAIDRSDGTMRRLSENQNGLLRSYVYPKGGIRGLSKASPSLDPFLNRLFFIRDDQVFRIDLDDPEPKERRLCALPSRWWGAYTHVSPDGKTFCVPCADPGAFGDEATQWEQLNQVPTRMKKLGLETCLYFIDTENGATRIAARIPFWVTHVQFDPAGSGRLLFNREGHSEGIPLPDRIWCLEPDGSCRPLAPEVDGEWRSHENWAPDGKSIVYHGKRHGRAFISARTWEGQLLHETPFDGVGCHHATALPDGRGMAVDRVDGMISLLDPATSTKETRQIDLCRHDTDYEDQDSHGHPLAGLDGGSVVFTSCRSGHCQVYEVAVPAGWRR